MIPSVSSSRRTAELNVGAVALVGKREEVIEV
jgi:hypothetical protein